MSGVFWFHFSECTTIVISFDWDQKNGPIGIDFHAFRAQNSVREQQGGSYGDRKNIQFWQLIFILLRKFFGGNVLFYSMHFSVTYESK